MSEETRALARGLIDAVNNGTLASSADELLAPDLVFHDTAAPELIRGKDGFAEYVGMLRSAFPDVHMNIEDMVVEENTASIRWTFRGTHQGWLLDMAPTGKEVEIGGIDILRFADGKLEEGWAVPDMLGLMRQLGAMPAAG